MQKPFFSIVVVSLNPGDRLEKTLNSIGNQSFSDYEVILKDGGSTDGSLDGLQEKGYFEEKNQIKIIQKKDKSIYDGMNQAVSYVSGRYVLFLNCGDYFYDESVLEKMQDTIIDHEQVRSAVFYGDIYDALRNNRVASNPHIDGFACYRNVPCHQACVYARDLFAQRGYKPKYRVRADYEHFLWCFYEKKARMIYVPVILASYEGGGFSETKENRKKSANEHKEITAIYMSKGELFKYRAILMLTLAPLRTKMAESPAMSGIYNRCKDLIYRNRK